MKKQPLSFSIFIPFLIAVGIHYFTQNNKPLPVKIEKQSAPVVIDAPLKLVPKNGL